MEAKYTKGPWEILRLFPFVVTTQGDAGKGFGGSIDPVQDKRNFALVIAMTDHCTRRLDEETRRANANLVAAAPDEDAALILLIEWGSRVTKIARSAEQIGHSANIIDAFDGAIENAKIALAKARGEI